ncbi:hypothetical protein Q2T40_15645 [Winogradskyella maritima]|uniref:PH (Pleckstrin Homology) domain-containing protein n=1 Tax=Winogradskyella maritima TaxID=1517766 RepID=A0ABV8AJS0_9FLAO|nr:hypothetical protein [Winogradskyella maritima]
MKVNVLTSKAKKATRNFNISMLILFFSLLIFTFTFWLPENKFNFLIFVIVGCTFIFGLVLTFVLVLIRKSSASLIEIDIGDVERLTVNSHISAKDIVRVDEIGYSGNFISLIIDKVALEVDNKSAFEILKNANNLNVSSQFINTKNLELSPKELFKSIMSILWASS